MCYPLLRVTRRATQLQSHNFRDEFVVFCAAIAAAAAAIDQCENFILAPYHFGIQFPIYDDVAYV